MTTLTLRRTLWWEDRGQIEHVDEDVLRTDPRSFVLLAEAGMGKSTLLGTLGGVEGFAFTTARRLINHVNPATLLGDASTLVIDALDEVTAQREGDAVDLVIRRLSLLGTPRFVLSCRVADWRSATALQALGDFYSARPLELHLDPLDRDDAMQALSSDLGNQRAADVLEHLETLGLNDLWSNPQTLNLVKVVAGGEGLPNSKGELFAAAVKLLCVEHREEKGDTPFAHMPEAKVLDAAGAAFAALILTGADALSRKVVIDKDEARVAEVAALPAAGSISDVLDSRLFQARGADRFSYTHRAIGEFLGARWLSRLADTARKRRRLLRLFGDRLLVPASLRGIHAWLAWHNPDLAPAIIAADPMGFVEYGDADNITVDQARILLAALRDLSRENPSFRDWREYRVAGLAHVALLPEIRDLLTAPDVEFGLRLLVLQALKNSALAAALSEVLGELLNDRNAAFANRIEAGERLAALDESQDWPAIIRSLRAQDDEDGVRLAIELVDKVGYDHFDDDLLVDVVLAQLPRAETTAGVLHSIQRRLPNERLDAVLDGLSKAAAQLGEPYERAGGDELTDLAYGLLARRLKEPRVDFQRLWSWLRPFHGEIGYQRETRVEIAQMLRADDHLRRSVQRLVILEQSDEQNIWHRSWRLSERSHGLALSEADVVALLNELDSADDRWRDIVQLTAHSTTDGSDARMVAMRFAAGVESREWLEHLAEPRVHEWQIKEERRTKAREAERRKRWEEHRKEFARNEDALRAGEYKFVVNPAQAYLKLSSDLRDGASDGPTRLEEWLGPALRDACLVGFEAFLTATSSSPTATEISGSHAAGKRWAAANIIVAALLERFRTGIGFEDLADERLMAGLFEIRHTRVDDHAGEPKLSEAIADVLRARGTWEAAQRLYFEPQFAQRNAVVDGLYALMGDGRDAELAINLALEWLSRYSDMPHQPEAELIDRLLASDQRDALRDIARRRREELPASDERRRNWDAVGLIVDFPSTSRDLEAHGVVEAELLWDLRARLGDRYGGGPAGRLGPAQLAWTIGNFRTLFPLVERPRSVRSGDTNAWDGSEYVATLISRLGDQTSDDAIDALRALKEAPSDGYSFALRRVAAEQKRKRVEADYDPITLAAIASTLADTAPATGLQLQAVVLEELRVIQAELRGSDVDYYDDFFDGGEPRVEDKCRDALLKMLRPLPSGIQALPEGHVADDKRCDIICLLGNLMVPIEIKGQWNSDLWTAADLQLDRLYVNDWRAECGIYVVLWFGAFSKKPLKKPNAGAPSPATPSELKEALVAQSVRAQSGRVEIVILDLTRPT